MTDTSSVPKVIHFHDWTVGNGDETACGIVDDDKLAAKYFEQSDPAARCEICEAEFQASRAYLLSCRICGEVFNTDREVTEHERRSHALTLVSHRKGTPCFRLNLQAHYNSMSSNALLMSAARQELKAHFSGYQFDFVPARMMLQNKGANSVLLGEAYVAEYLVIAR